MTDRSVPAVSRRRFLRAGAAAFSAPLFVPASALGRAGAVPPSDRVNLGVVGAGWMGLGNLELFLEEPLAQVVVVCDVDADHLAKARETVAAKYGGGGCAATADLFEVFGRPDVDAVCLSLPDHWHGVASIAAARAGKDIYGEKPVAHNWAEARAVCDAVARYGRVWQTGSWQRSIPHFRQACQIVRNGRIGQVLRVEVILPGGHTDFAGTASQVAASEPPKALDYERWLGPAPWKPYCPARVHKNWRYCLDYGGGLLMDWIGHHLDIAHWGLGLDETGPLEVTGEGEFPPDATIYDAPARYRVVARYAGDVTIEITGRQEGERGGAKWIGNEGWVWVDRKGMEVSRPELSARLGPGEIELHRSPGHRREFLECVRSRGVPVCPCETGLRSATPGYLGLISMLTGRTVHWDPAAQRIVGDAVAERLLRRPLRSPWRL